MHFLHSRFCYLFPMFIGLLVVIATCEPYTTFVRIKFALLTNNTDLFYFYLLKLMNDIFPFYTPSIFPSWLVILGCLSTYEQFIFAAVLNSYVCFVFIMFINRRKLSIHWEVTRFTLFCLAVIVFCAALNYVYPFLIWFFVILKFCKYFLVHSLILQGHMFLSKWLLLILTYFFDLVHNLYWNSHLVLPLIILLFFSFVIYAMCYLSIQNSYKCFNFDILTYNKSLAFFYVHFVFFVSSIFLFMVLTNFLY